MTDNVIIRFSNVLVMDGAEVRRYPDLCVHTSGLSRSSLDIITDRLKELGHNHKLLSYDVSVNDSPPVAVQVCDRPEGELLASIRVTYRSITYYPAGTRSADRLEDVILDIGPARRIRDELFQYLRSRGLSGNVSFSITLEDSPDHPVRFPAETL